MSRTFARLTAVLLTCAALMGCAPDPCPPGGFARFVCETGAPGTVVMRFGSVVAPVIHERTNP